MFPANAESLESIRARASRFIERLLSVRSNDTVLIVGHDSINRRLVSAITGDECSASMKNASVSVFDVSEQREVSVVEFNSVAHLG
jgi:probable phosphoglycerate mutase